MEREAPLSHLSRRKLLSRIGMGGIGILGGVALLPSPPKAIGEITATTEAAPPDESDAVDETDTPYAIWQYRRDRGSYTPTAPINVVFPLERVTFEDLIAVFRSAGWYPFPEEYARYAWDRAEDRYVLQQWTGAETYFGKVGRYHVRCWHTDGTASMQAHLDTPATPKHGIASYAKGRSAIAEMFAAAGWAVDPTRLWLDNARDPDHDGWATVIFGPEGQ